MGLPNQKGKMVITAILLLIWFLLCWKSYANQIDNKKTYYQPVPNLYITFDPQRVDDFYNLTIILQLYDTLLKYDEFLELQPHLASTWLVTNDGLKYIITIKSDIKFHNGDLLTVDDVIFTLHRFIKNFPKKFPELSSIDGVGHFLQGKTKSITGLKKISQTSLEINLTHPSPTLLHVLATYNLAILPHKMEQMGTSFLQQPFGTGPFKFAEFEKNKSLRLEANKDYFTTSPHIDEIVYRIAARQEAIEGFNKKIFHDLQWYSPYQEEIKIDYSVTKFPIPQVDVLIFNTSKPPFNNKLARQAFVHAIDKDQLLSKCFGDKSKATGFIPHGIGGYNKNFKGILYNPDRARGSFITYTKQHSSELEKGITILRFENRPCKKDFDKIILKNLQEIGFKINIKYITYQNFENEYFLKRDFDVVEITLGSDQAEASSILNYFRSNYTENFSGYKNSMYDNLLQKALSTTDKHERFNIYFELQRLLDEEVLTVNLYYEIKTVVFQRDVVGITAPTILPFIPMNSIQLTP